MARRRRIDSAAAGVEVMQDVLRGELAPPDHAKLHKDALPFWTNIMRGRAREEWEATP
ncbi:hypothetical protein [Sphingopyxis yananensis]|uniref:hypothetical protein n=1 Tax=Sphingopyxis yananensis TaxID=2886687 RepID=UPI001D1269E2|nr:hypothetical protein [Sphingopyxis yananensis]MCC2602260.1 hypothetical protein [Sphingopyxis yananensis]